jgi:iron uptake system component EfeO
MKVADRSGAFTLCRVRNSRVRRALPLALLVALCATACDASSDPPAATATTAGASISTPEPAADTTTVSAAELQRATGTYRLLLDDQLVMLQARTTEFSDAIRAGDLATAKSMYNWAREPWTQVELVAELFPLSDIAIDSRADDHPLGVADPAFIGFHALEYVLWAQGSIDGVQLDGARLADQLDRDVSRVVAELRSVAIDPEMLTNGAAASIEEAAQTKVTGHEDIYSHTDLATLDGNVRGARAAFDLVAPMLIKVDANLADDISDAYANLDAVLDQYRSSNSFQPFDAVTTADRNRLKTATATLSEYLARVTGALGLVVEG